MTTFDLNVNPYFDDFDESNEYYQLLFRPGQSIQARELTQIQSVLQNQFKFFGSHIFKDGSIVTGANIKPDTNITYVKLRDQFSSVDIDVNSYKDQTIEGVTSGVKAKVILVEDGLETNAPNYKTLMVKYVEGNDDIGSFQDGENIKIVNQSPSATLINSEATGKGTILTVDNGIFYFGGYFISHNTQTVIVDKYTDFPNKKVGINFVNSFVGSDQDFTLNDPSRGSYNYAAPGADRLKIVTNLQTIDLNSQEPDEFFTLIEFNQGRIQQFYQKTQYNEIRKELARRTNDESGSYAVNPFSLYVRQHLNDENGNKGLYTDAQGGDSNLLAVGVESGKAYVQGFEYETFGTNYVDLKKGNDVIEVEQQTITTSYGPYVLVNELSGNWDVTSGDNVKVKLEAFPVNSISSGNYSDAKEPSNAVIGTAKVRSIVYDQSEIAGELNSGPVYRAYLYDIQMSLPTMTVLDASGFSPGEQIVGQSTGVTASIKSINSNTFTLSGNISGLFVTGEVLTGNISGATGVAISINNNIVSLSNIVGTFQVGETITGGISSDTALVSGINSNEISIESIVGANFQVGETITGGTSGESGVIASITNNDLLLENKELSYISNETVTGGTSSAIGNFVEETNGEIIINNVSGNFQIGETLDGSTSGESSVIQSIIPSIWSLNPKAFLFDADEQVSGQVSGATADVVSIINQELTVDNVSGTFQVGEIIAGGTNGEGGTITAINGNVLTLTYAFVVGERVLGGTSGATADVVEITDTNITFSNIAGSFQANETITGGLTTEEANLVSNTGLMISVNIQEYNFILGENIIGSITSATGVIDSKDGLEIGLSGTTTGLFNTSETVVGQTSGASSIVKSRTPYDMAVHPFSDVRSIYGDSESGNSNIADIVLTNNRNISQQSGVAELQENTSNGLVFPLNQKAVKRLRDSGGNIETQFQALNHQIVTTTSGGTATLGTGGNDITFPYSVGVLSSTNTRKFLVIAQNDTSSFKAGQVIDVVANGGSITINSETSATLDIGTAETLSVSVLTSLQYRNAAESSKRIIEDVYVKINLTNHENGREGPWNLGLCDILNVKNVWGFSTEPTDENGTDLTQYFITNNGQKDNFYDNGSLRWNINRSNNNGVSLSSYDYLLVKLDYFIHDHSSGTGYFSVDSYPVDDVNFSPNTIKTQEIPVFTSPFSGKRFDLRDCVDFRTKISETATASTTIAGASTNPAKGKTFNVYTASGNTGFIIPTPDEQFTIDLEYYMGRNSRIVLDSNGNFGVVDGVPSLNPVTPPVPGGAMSLAIIHIPPFPSLVPKEATDIGRTDYAISIKPEVNRRYTMRDIGTIEQRVSNLEYYVSLNMLEKAAKDQLIIDENGLNRFKNGIIVDNFRNHSIGDVTNDGYQVGVDTVSGGLRPSTSVNNVDIVFNDESSSNFYRGSKDGNIEVNNGNRFTVSESIYVGPSLISSTASATISAIVGNKIYLTNIIGKFNVSDTVIGSSSNANDTVLKRTIEPAGKVVTLPFTHSELAKNPFATKPRNCVGELLFNWDGDVELSPSSDHWVDTNRRPDVQTNFQGTNDSWENLDNAWEVEWGSWERDRRPIFNPIRFDAIREVSNVDTTTGVNINNTPNNVRDQQDNDLSFIPFMREVVVTFISNRLKPNTRVFAFFDGEPVSEHCRPMGGNFGDTLTTDSTGTIAGQFRIPAGQFRVGTKPFKLIDDNQNRDSFSTTSSQATFSALGLESLIEPPPPPRPPRPPRRGWLLRGRRGGAWGGSEGSGSSADPLAQSFFVSGYENGVMMSKIDVFFKTKSDTLPITLQLRKMINGIPSTTIMPNGQVTLFPDQVNTSETSNDPTPFRFKSPVYLESETEYCFVLLPAGNNPDYQVWVSELGQNQLGTTRRVTAQPNIGILFTSANDRTWSPVQSEDMKFTAHIAKFDTGTVGTVYFENKEVAKNYQMNDVYVNLPVIDFNQTQSNWVVSTAQGTSSYNQSSYQAIDLNTTYNFTTERAVLTTANEASQLSGSKSFILRGTLRTSNPYISPILDLDKAGIRAIGNRINNNSNNEEKSSGGSSLARYITRRAVLADGQNAEDIKVYLTAYNPAGTNIKVYARIQNEVDTSDFDDRGYIELVRTNGTSTSSISNRNDFLEIQYSLPDSVLTGANGEVQYIGDDGLQYSGYKIFAIKIVLLSSTTSNIPRIRDMRTIALQI